MKTVQIELDENELDLLLCALIAFSERFSGEEQESKTLDDIYSKFKDIQKEEFGGSIS